MATVGAIFANNEARALLELPGRFEVPFFADDECGLSLRCKPDKMCDGGLVIDLKTSETGTTPREFAKSVANYGYHIQDYFYRRVLRAPGIHAHQMAFIAVGKTPPYTVDCYTLSDEFLKLAETVVENALTELAERTRSGDWSGRTAGRIIELSPPGWLKFNGSYDV